MTVFPHSAIFISVECFIGLVCGCGLRIFTLTYRLGSEGNVLSFLANNCCGYSTMLAVF